MTARRILLQGGSWVLILFVIVFLCVHFIGCSKGAPLTVEAKDWKRTLSVELLGPVNEEGWEVPSGATITSQASKFHHNESYRCWGPHLTWNLEVEVGFHTCERPVNQQYYSWTIVKWHKVREPKAEGINDSEPKWPEVILSANEKLTDFKNEQYRVLFRRFDKPEAGMIPYTCRDQAEWEAFTLHSTWHGIFRMGRLEEITGLELSESAPNIASR